ncbi:MAG: low specificity L-threonine aldolase [Chitinophagales bacterium]|nr:low specificity L-threonine aldolase [Chitinophagales bacterium]MCO5279605.1 low specificity L-threonine aldolase [Chitinophagales bacterium]OJV24279.1 MAG: threonine aldolase [Bacteroidetes bacterium 37-13]
MIVDLRSDTLTKPTPEMLKAMFAADAGDDVFGENKTVCELEEKTAAMFGMEAALFLPSGTMANQTAIKAHTQPLDEVICDKLSHIYNYETGAWAMLSGVSLRLANGTNGILQASDITANILPDFDWNPNTKLVCVENTVNKGGGAVYPIETLKEISAACKQNNLLLHCDGARIFNALTTTQSNANVLHGIFDSISVCISKGLGAPVGSLLAGKKDFIKKCRKIRKALGGGMRQSGYLAAACIYALDNHIERLQQDHLNAQKLGTALQNCSLVKSVLPTQTNIVIFEVDNSQTFAQLLLQNNIRVQPFSPTQVRMVTHLDISENEIKRVCSVLEKL